MNRTRPDDVDALLARLPTPAPLSAARVAALRARIDHRTQGRARPRRWGLALVVVLVAAAALASSVLRAPRRVPVVAPPPPAHAPPVIDPIPERVKVHETSPVLATTAPPSATNPATNPATIQATRPVATNQATTAPATPPKPQGTHGATPKPQGTHDATPAETDESTLARESRLVGAALRQLRARRDPRGALAMLDEHAAQFPTGTLVAEARAARIEALLARGDEAAALALLDRHATSAEHLVLRGELRFAAGRVADAQRDFETASIGARDTIEQRALYGRAACQLARGDRAGARRDLEAYLQRFPRGRSAAAARTALDSLKGSESPRP